MARIPRWSRPADSHPIPATQVHSPRVKPGGHGRWEGRCRCRNDVLIAISLLESSQSAPHSCPPNATRPAVSCGPCRSQISGAKRLALAGLEALVHLVDDVNAAATADELVRAVASHQRLQRVADLHLTNPRSNKRGAKAPENWPLHKETEPGCQRAIASLSPIARPLTRRLWTRPILVWNRVQNRLPCPANRSPNPAS